MDANVQPGQPVFSVEPCGRVGDHGRGGRAGRTEQKRLPVRIIPPAHPSPSSFSLSFNLSRSRIERLPKVAAVATKLFQSDELRADRRIRQACFRGGNDPVGVK